jgi:hypothetical protein
MNAYEVPILLQVSIDRNGKDRILIASALAMNSQWPGLPGRVTPVYHQCGTGHKGGVVTTPALLNRMSRRPKSAITVSITRRQSEARV